MQKIIAGGREVEIPSPVYILPSTIKVSEDTNTISGKCIFPSSDPTIGDRVDHANICHEMFAVWNCAHIWRERNGLGRLFAIKTQQKVVGGRMTPPDTEIDVVLLIFNVRKRGGRIVGSARARFSLNGETLLLVEVERFVEEKN